MKSQKNAADRRIWVERHGLILKEIFDTYELNYHDFAKAYDMNDATVRYWFEGHSFPNKYSQKSLDSYFLQEIENSPERDRQLRRRIQQLLGKDNMAVYQQIERQSSSFHCFLTKILHYCVGAGKKDSAVTEWKREAPETGKTRAVVFDFDGTLTSGKTNRTTWESIWSKLGYDVSECQQLHLKFNHHEIDHPQWCQLTEDKFKQRSLHRDDVEMIAKKIRLLPGVYETFEALQQKDIKIYIVSGSILLVIQRVLGNLFQYVDGIRANQFFFDERGFLTRIVGTKYDFEGKADFISEMAADLQISPRDVLFVGNSVNDQFAYQSGARTLCINPKLTDITNNSVWNECITECKNLQEILPYIRS